jgi:hypothetical protein
VAPIALEHLEQVTLSAQLYAHFAAKRAVDDDAVDDVPRRP